MATRVFGPHDRASIVITIDVLSDEHAMVEAWIQMPGDEASDNGADSSAEAARLIVIPSRAAACSVQHDGEMVHLDVRVEDSRTLAVTLGPADRVLYAQSDLIAQLTRGGGRYDSPDATRYALQARAVRA